MSRLGDVLKPFKLPEIISKIGSPFAMSEEEAKKEFFDSGYEILVVSGIDQGVVHPLNQKEITLGRREALDERKKNFILFSDPSVSKAHALLRWDEDLEKYVIYHLSDQSPTLVNNRAIKKSLLNPGYNIQLGELKFKMISIKEKKLKESTIVWEKFKQAEGKESDQIDTGFKLVVVEGPDKGKTFNLDKRLLILGRRKGPGDMREAQGILLSDRSLPDELALLVWNEYEKKFAIFQSEDSPVPLQLFRVVESLEGSQVVGKDYQNILEDKDSIKTGQTIMVIHKITEQETPEAAVDIEKEIRAEMPPAEDEAGTKTSAGTFRIDFIFETLEGSDAGNKISLLSDEMIEGRVITFGSRGNIRQNEIEIDDPFLSNTQGYFEFTEGNLYLINESGEVEISVNSYVIGENEKIVLNSGDRIKMGNTVFGFTDNRVLAALKNYNLAVISGSEKDKSRRFQINKTMIFIGRGSSCDVRIHDSEVSRLHAVLSFKNSRFHLEHKSKVNPTFVNGISLKRGQDRIVFPGDKIYLSGKTILQLVRIVRY